jgi:hypothetical protein
MAGIFLRFSQCPATFLQWQIIRLQLRINNFISRKVNSLFSFSILLYMKYILLLLIFHFVAIVSMGQKLDSASMVHLSPSEKQEVNQYLVKAKNSKTAGLALLIGGGVLSGVALVIAASNINYDWTQPEDENSGVAETVVALVGIGAMLGSIPCFINVHKQREKARAIVYREKNVSLSPQMVLPNSSSYGIRLVIPFGR